MLAKGIIISDNSSMVTNFKGKLKSARPSLYYVSPLTYLICWGYAGINIFLGIGLYQLYEPQVPIAVANIFSYQIWGILFFITGIVSIYALIHNGWLLTRRTLIIGLALKSVWAIALTVRCFTDPQTMVITFIWLFFVYVQAVTYIFFIPKTSGKNNR